MFSKVFTQFRMFRIAAIHSFALKFVADSLNYLIKAELILEVTAVYADNHTTILVRGS